MAPGALVAAAAIALLASLHGDSSFVSVVLPAEVLLGLGLSTAMVPAFSTATHGVDQREAGGASPPVNPPPPGGASPPPPVPHPHPPPPPAPHPCPAPPAR